MTTQRWTSLGEVYIAAPAAPSPASFGVTVGGVLAAIGAFSYWRGHLLRAEAASAIGLVLIAIAVIRPPWLTRLAKGWGRVGHAVGWINSRLLLTALFAVVIWPIGVISRLLGSDPLGRRRTGSGWTAYSTRIRDARHVERMF
jgi:hypothetical protein